MIMGIIIAIIEVPDNRGPDNRGSTVPTNLKATCLHFNVLKCVQEIL